MKLAPRAMNKSRDRLKTECILSIQDIAHFCACCGCAFPSSRKLSILKIPAIFRADRRRLHILEFLVRSTSTQTVAAVRSIEKLSAALKALLTLT